MLFDWKDKLKYLKPLAWNGKIPNYAVVFVFQNLFGFRLDFAVITLLSMLAYLLGFAAVYLLGQVVSELPNFSVQDLLYYYLPLLALAMTLNEVIGFFIRRYSEALPQVFSDFCGMRFHLLLARSGSYKLMNLSKERVLTLISRYLSHSSIFINDWIWSITGKLTEFVIIVGVLSYQSPTVLVLNLGYILIFLSLSFYISSKFSPIARDLAERSSEAATVSSGFVLNLNLVRRLGLQDFLKDTVSQFLARTWCALDRVRRFHAQRWFFQLNLFNFLYLGTLGYAIYQIKAGLLPLGYLILIKWAFDRLWLILVYAIEYFVTLVQQKEDARLLQKLLEEVLNPDKGSAALVKLEAFQALELRNIQVQFTKHEDLTSEMGARHFKLRVPNFWVKPGDKIGIIGPSGAGKSTLFDVLLQQIPYSGEYYFNGQIVPSEQAAAVYSHISSVNSEDPFFKLSLRENLLLGKELPPERLDLILSGAQCQASCPTLEAVIGSADFHLSTGQFQRLRLARGLIKHSEIYLLDEPFNGIDGPTRDLIMEFLAEYLRDRTVILITHNPLELSLVQSVYRLEPDPEAAADPARLCMVLK